MELPVLHRLPEKDQRAPGRGDHLHGDGHPHTAKCGMSIRTRCCAGSRRRRAKKELTPLYESMLKGDTEKMAEILSENLMETISFYDYQESYYHGFLVGLLKNIGNYIVQSNRESGNGRPDILVRYPSVRGKAIIIEIKVSKTYQGLEEKCGEALEQIEKQDYAAALRQEGYRDILKYGVAFYRKECMVKKAE